MQQIQYSTSTFARNTVSAVNGSTTESFESVDEFILSASNADTCGLGHQGNDTQFDKKYGWRAPIDFVMRKIILNLGFAFNVSAYTSGSPNFTSVDVAVTQFTGGAAYPLLTTSGGTLRYATGHSALSATGTQVFIVTDALPVNKLINAGDWIEFRLITNCTLGTTTSQQGILPSFPYQASSCFKPFSQSEIAWEGYLPGYAGQYGGIPS